MLRVLLLALALLAAQQSALAHGVWHAAGAGQSQQQDKLCPLHDALGTVAGALDAVPPKTPILTLQDQAFGSLPSDMPWLELPRPSSRGPPSVL